MYMQTALDHKFDAMYMQTSNALKCFANVNFSFLTNFNVIDVL